MCEQVHFNTPMNPLELEMYHQIKNVIGVNPSFYEYLFMVDADTTVHPLSLNRLISAYVFTMLIDDVSTHVFSGSLGWCTIRS